MTGTQSSGNGPARIGPMEIQQKEFRVSRFGGYKMRDVDEFLDELTTTMGELTAENDRLRAQATVAPVVGSPDLDDVGRQADEIIQRARDEAAQIVADARAGAAAASTIAAAAPGDRAAVDAFLLQEREFLQGLGVLVQGHAESVKRMARAARSPAPGRAAPTTQTPAERAEPAAAEATDRADTSTRAPSSTPASSTEPVPPSEQSDDAPSPEAGEPTIRIDEPQPATAPASTADAEGDGSLRELFWGEED